MPPSRGLTVLARLVLAARGVLGYARFNECLCGPLATNTDENAVKMQINATTAVCDMLDHSYIETVEDHKWPPQYFSQGNEIYKKGVQCTATLFFGISNGCFDCLCRQQKPDGFTGTFHSYCDAKGKLYKHIACRNDLGCWNED